MRAATKRIPKQVASKQFRAIAKSQGAIKEKRDTALVRLSPGLKKRLNMKLAEEGRKFQDVAEELITRYVDGDSHSPSELEMQVESARASMRKNAVALRELAK